MAGENPTSSQAEPINEPAQSQSEPQGAGELEAKEVDWKSVARKWEERAKASYKDTVELKKLKETTTQTVSKLENENKQLKQQLETFQTAQQQKEWKAKVSEETGVPVDVLRGTTLEEIQEHAKTVATLIADSHKPTPPIVPTVGTTPQSKPAQGIRALAHSLFGSNE